MTSGRFKHSKWTGVLLLLLLGVGAASPSRAEAPGAAKAIHWIPTESEALRVARSERRPVLADFWADWCGACAELDRSVWSDPRVQAEVARFVPARLDGSEGSVALTSGRYDDAARRWGINVLPSVVLLDPRGNVLDRIVGVVTADEMRERLEAGARKCAASGTCR